MQDKERFISILGDVLDKANENGKKITIEEIKEAFGNDNLKEGQFEAIYEYLVEHKVSIQNYIPGLKEEADKNSEKKEDSVYLSMYLQDLEGVQECNASEIEALYEEMKYDMEGAKTKLIEGNLHMVVRVAKEYQGQGLVLEDLIQEGNIGLMNGVMSFNEMTGKLLKGYLEDEVRRYILAAIEHQYYEKNVEQEVLIKVNRLSRLAKELEEELGRHPEVLEVAEYMGVTEEEVRNIIRLSKELSTDKKTR